MAQIFHYKGRNKEGVLVEGILESNSLDAAINTLNEQGVFIINIESQGKNFLIKLLTLRLDKPKVKLQELLIFCRQMHTLTKAGISLIVAVKRLGEISRNPTMIETLQGIEKSILAGQSLAASMQRYPDVFSTLFIEMIKVGEESGRLDEAFLQISEYMALEHATYRRFKAAFRYPLIVVLAVIASLVILNIFVIPNFAQLYTSFHTKLPLPTVLLLAISAFLRDNWHYFLAITLVAYLLVRAYIKTKKGRLLWDKYQLHVPIIGVILERIMLARFARTMAIVFRTGIPIERGLVLIAGAVGNEYVRTRIMVMQQNIEHGDKLSYAAARTKILSPLVLQMLTVGEETGVVDAMLQEAAAFYEREVDYDLQSISDKIEPILLCIVAAMVLMLAIAVFLPMWDIYQFAQGR